MDESCIVGNLRGALICSRDASVVMNDDDRNIDFVTRWKRKRSRNEKVKSRREGESDTKLARHQPLGFVGVPIFSRYAERFLVTKR